MTVSSTHLVLVPSYNAGRLLLATVGEILAHWRPVWIVDDGSTDDGLVAIEALARTEPAVRVIRRPRNGGKGAAVFTGAEAALAAGFTHALVMDADGQHPAEKITTFMHASRSAPAAVVLGQPLFGPDAPRVRRWGRQLSVALVWLEVFGARIGDPLFGFRVYPLQPLARIAAASRYGRRFDFDPEIAVRFAWSGAPLLKLPAPCRYRPGAEGGVSHFHYGRDNARMIWLHARLLAELLLWRWPAALRLRRGSPQT